jgi:hypothetical protein
VGDDVPIPTLPVVKSLIVSLPLFQIAKLLFDSSLDCADPRFSNESMSVVPAGLILREPLMSNLTDGEDIPIPTLPPLYTNPLSADNTPSLLYAT